jgi:hypothetical protein
MASKEVSPMQVHEIMTPTAELVDANAMIRDAARTTRRN